MLNAVSLCVIVCDPLQFRQGETKNLSLHTSLLVENRTESAQTFLCCNRNISHSFASSLQGGVENPKLLNITLDPRDLNANSLDGQLYVGIIPYLGARFSFVRTREGISV